MEQMLKVAAAGLCAAVIGLTIRRSNPEMTLLLLVAAALAVLACALPLIAPIKDFVNSLFELTGLPPSVPGPMIRILGVCVVTRIASNACKDCKAEALGACVELMGGCVALYLALPLLSMALNLLTSFT